MSEVANNSENQENCVQAQNEADAVEPVTNNNAKLASAAGAPSTEDDAGVASTNECVAVAAKPAAEESSPKVENKKSPVKRTPSKRMSFIERAQKESEELVKNLGGSLELEGGRRTRSSTRGTPTRSAVVATPPPAKKARASTASSTTTTTTPTRRGRGRKIDTTTEPVDAEVPTEEEHEKAEATEEATSEIAADNNDSEKSSVENAENSVVDAANSAAAAEEKETAQTEKKNVEAKTAGVDESAVVVKGRGDKTDGILESIPEVEQNNVDHKPEEQEQKPAEEAQKQDSKMETDEDPKSAEVPAIATATATEAEVNDITDKSKAEITPTPTEPATSTSTGAESSTATEKQPTPEPMEVDSASSKDAGDAIESTTTNSACVEKMDDDIPEPPTEQTNSTEPSSDADKQSAVEPAAETVQVIAEESSVVVVEGKKAESMLETNSTSAVSVNETKSVVAPVEIDAAAAGEPQATTNATTLATTAENNKSENDFCEPKIVSPPTTTDGAVAATPQYCN